MLKQNSKKKLTCYSIYDTHTNVRVLERLRGGWEKLLLQHLEVNTTAQGNRAQKTTKAEQRLEEPVE